MKKNNITVHMGEAHILTRDTVRVKDSNGQESELKAKNIVVATGSTPAAIPGVVIDGEKILTYHEAILQEKRPDSVVIIGAGAIGVEFATIWNSYGTEVTIVEMLPRVVPLEDEEISAELAKALTRKKIKVLTNHKVVSLKPADMGVSVIVSSEGEEKVLEADQALVAIGFKPNSKGFGLEQIGVKISEKGFIEIDDGMATNVKGIYAIGDVTGKFLLAHIASAQGILCAENIAGVEFHPLNYTNTPRATYCQPQVASFGLTEKQAVEMGKGNQGWTIPIPGKWQGIGFRRLWGFCKNNHRCALWGNTWRTYDRTRSY